MKPIVNPFQFSTPLKFHGNHSGVEISGDGYTATWRTRIRGQKKYSFSHRPIKRNEKVYVRIMENSILNEAQPENQKNRATFGFTTFDPAKLSTAQGQLELYSDVKASMVTETLKKGAIYSFWMDDDGRLHRGEQQQQQQHQLHDSEIITDSNLPIWFMTRARGNITLKIVESDIVYMVAGDMGQGKPCTIVYPNLANAFAHIMQVNNNKSNNAIINSNVDSDGDSTNEKLKQLKQITEDSQPKA